MPKTIEEYKKQEIIGFDVWLDSGVCIKGFKEFDEKAIEQAKKQIIEMIKKDECSSEENSIVQCSSASPPTSSAKESENIAFGSCINRLDCCATCYEVFCV